MTSRKTGLALLVAAVALPLWVVLSREADREANQESSEATTGAEPRRRAAPPTARGEDAGRRPAAAEPLSSPAERTDALRRSEAPPNPGRAVLYQRAQSILNAYRERRDPRLLGALLRPRPLPEPVREALRITCGFAPEERRQAVAGLAALDSPELRRILESLATNDTDPAVRELALDALQALDRAR